MQSLGQLIHKAGELFQSGNYKDCEALIERILAKNPAEPLALYMLGSLYSYCGKNGLAIPYLSMASMFLRKGLPEARLGCLHNLSVALRTEGHEEASMQAAQEALEVDENCSEAWNNMAAAHVNNGNPKDGEKYAKRCVELNPDLAEGWNNLAHILLEQERWPEAWEAYEWRWKVPDAIKKQRNFPGKYWDGKPTGTLVVHGEQGLGDEIMFLSMLEEVKPLCKRLVVEANHKLIPLLRRSLNCEVVANPEQVMHITDGKIDSWISMGSLGRLFRRDEQSFQKQKPYLKPDPSRVAYWRSRLEALGPGPYIGLAWKGGTLKTHEAVRNPPIELFADLIKEIPAQFVSLQYTRDAALQAGLWGIPHWQQAIDDIDEQAALIGACDSVISVAQLALHLAGAQGKETIGIIGSKPAWRYGLTRHRMAWYPSVRLERQQGKDWSGLMRWLIKDINKPQLRMAAE
jgi:hypothetical protein